LKGIEGNLEHFSKEFTNSLLKLAVSTLLYKIGLNLGFQIGLTKSIFKSGLINPIRRDFFKDHF
jgi:hypothetical protein